MTLDEAIKHAEEKANNLFIRSDPNREYPCFTTEEARAECEECAEEHKQLALWLKELKMWRTWYDIMQNIISNRAM